MFTPKLPQEALLLPAGTAKPGYLLRSSSSPPTRNAAPLSSHLPPYQHKSSAVDEDAVAKLPTIYAGQYQATEAANILPQRSYLLTRFTSQALLRGAKAASRCGGSPSMATRSMRVNAIGLLENLE